MGTSKGLGNNRSKYWAIPMMLNTRESEYTDRVKHWNHSNSNDFEGLETYFGKGFFLSLTFYVTVLSLVELHFQEKRTSVAVARIQPLNPQVCRSVNSD